MGHKQVLSIVLVLGLALVAVTMHTEGDKTGLPKTQITIDGRGEDWVGRPVLLSLPAGDAQPGFVDMTTGYGFVNQHAIYLLVEVVDAGASVTQFMVWFKADSRALLFEWSVHDAFGVVSEEMPNGDLILIGQAIHSAIALGPALEMRIDLRDLELPEDLFLESINAHAGPGRPVDVWGPMVAPPRVNEADPEHLLAEVLVLSAERPPHFSVVDRTTESGYLYRSFLQTPWDLAWGPDDCLYIVDMHGRHVVRLAPDGTMDDLGIWRNPGLWADAPTALAFDSVGNLYVSDNPVIYAVSVGGKVNKLPDIQGRPVAGLAFSPNDELYYTDMSGGRVLRVGPNGRSQVVASGIPGAQDLAFSHDGALYVTQIGPNKQIVKVDVKTGVVTPFFTDEMFIGGDPLFLAVDQEGDLWAAAVNTLFQLSPDGTPKPFRVDGRTYSGNVFELDVETAGGIAFDDKSRLWIASFTSTIWRLDPLKDPSQGMMLNLIVPGFCASDLEIGPNGGVYAYNVNPHPGELWRISPEGEVEVLYQFDHHGNAAYDKIAGLAMDNEGNLYIGLVTGEIKSLSSKGRLTHYAWLPSRAQRMTFGTDGCLYAAVGGPDEPKSIVRIVGVDNYTAIINRIDGKPLGPKGVVHIDAAPEEGLYLFDEYYSKLYYVDFDGQASVVADLPGTASPATMAVSPQGDIFLVLHHALDPYPDEYSYSVLRIDPRGNIEIYAEAIMGDPLGAVISPDGRWLYIAENGAIDKIPIIGSD